MESLHSPGQNLAWRSPSDPGWLTSRGPDGSDNLCPLGARRPAGAPGDREDRSPVAGRNRRGASHRDDRALAQLVRVHLRSSHQRRVSILQDRTWLGGLRQTRDASPGHGSVSKEAADYGREHGIAVIDGGCPCMFGPTADPGHKAMRTLLTITGNVPRKV